MKSAALELLFGVLLVAVILAIGWTYNTRLHQAQARAETAEATVRTLTAELQHAKTSMRVVTEYVDRVQVVKERGATITKEIPVYVTAKADAACPVPVGFVRVHNAAAENLPNTSAPADVDAPASGIALSTVAATVTDNYNTCHQTAAQLSALQDWVRSVTP